MTHTKDPAAHGASARRAVVEVDRTLPEPTDLPLIPYKGKERRLAPDRDGAPVRSAKDAEDIPEERDLREDNVVGRKRLKSSVSVVSIKRAIAATAKANWHLSAFEIRPDGTLILRGGDNGTEAPVDLFDQWADKL